MCVDLSRDCCGLRVRGLVPDCFEVLEDGSGANVVGLLLGSANKGEGAPWARPRASAGDMLVGRDSGAGTDMAVATARAARGRRDRARGGILFGSERGGSEACAASTCGDSPALIRSTDWRGGSPEATTRALFLGLRGLFRNFVVAGSSP